MDTNYINSLWEKGYSVKDLVEIAQKSYDDWAAKKQENKKIEEARTALTVAVANYVEALGINVPQESIEETINMLKSLENTKVEVKFGSDTEADKRLRKFLRGIM